MKAAAAKFSGLVLRDAAILEAVFCRVAGDVRTFDEPPGGPIAGDILRQDFAAVFGEPFRDIQRVT